MSVHVVRWALNDASNVPPGSVAVLLGLAWHAEHDGRSAFPTEQTLAAYARKTPRQVRRDLRALEAAGLIRVGDQSAVAHRRADRRPVVYDLALRTDTGDRSPTGLRADTGDRSPTSARTSTGGHSRPERADTGDRNGRTLVSAEKSLEKSLKGPLAGAPARASALARLAADADTTEDEINHLIDKTRAERPDISSPLRWLRTCHENGDLPAMLAARRNGQNATRRKAWGDWCETLPECAHGRRGGQQAHPETGLPRCAECRAESTTDRRTPAPVCPRCQRPADRLITYPGGDQLGPCCAYPAGGAPEDATEGDMKGRR